MKFKGGCIEVLLAHGAWELHAMVGLGTDAPMHEYHLQFTHYKEYHHFYDIWQNWGKGFGAD